MILGGIQKLSLVDFPGCVAATVFTVGCNFRCPFCHNPELVLSSRSMERGALSEKEFFSFLHERKSKIDGVCITGGEPTIQPDILDFVAKIKKEGFLVKLDSNGTRPDVLKKALDQKLLDFVAMDIKNSLGNYPKTCGRKNVDIERIKLSVELIRNSGLRYEFRTTVVPSIHKRKDFKEIGKWLEGSRKYVLQKYQDEGKILSEELRKKQKGATMDLEKIRKMVDPFFEEVSIR